MSVKLQKFIASVGIASRRKAETMIEAGRVTVNGQRAHIGQRIEANTDTIAIDGRVVSQVEKRRYFAINKPAGLVSTSSDELGRKTVLSMLPEVAERLYPVGRLDRESEGLMILTNDGELTHRLTHPSKKIAKVYEVLVKGRPTAAALNHLRRGVKLKEGYTQPADVAILDHESGNTWLEITIHEGMNHQVRRMLERVGYDTLRLIRTAMGPLSLDELGEAEVLELPAEKIKELKTAVGL